MSSARNDALFTLDGDEDFLLEWDLYQSTKDRCIPTLPRWWYQLSTRQRNIVRGTLIACGVVGLIVLVSTTVTIHRRSPSVQSQSDIVGVSATAPVSYNIDVPQPPTPPTTSTISEPMLPDTQPDTGIAAQPTPYLEADSGTGLDADTFQEAELPLPPPPPAPPPAQAPASFPQCTWSSYRLPGNVRPFLYDISLQLDAPLARANGSVRIALALDAPADCLVLHADPSLNVTALPLETTDGTVPVELQRPSDSRDGQLHVAVPSPLPTGDVFLTLTFDYPVAGGFGGLYRAQFSSADGSQEVLAATQFAAMRARKALPCLDEPALKAPVKMQITAPSNVTVLFNTDAAGTEDTGGGMMRHTFKQTPPIATYLIALVAGDLAHEEVLAVGQAGMPRLPVRVWARRSAAESLTVAAHAAAAAVQGMEEALGVQYAGGRIGKLDLVGIPEFAAGAMENWGLITFRETDLFVPQGDPDTGGASIHQLYRVPRAVAHEVSHMWFGDLVTLPWWTDTWLNEGFARYFERIAASFFWNKYDKSALPTELTAAGPINYMDGFVSEVLDKALTADALPSAFALSRPEAAVQSEADAQAAFGRVAYDKGASVLRMLHAHMLRRAAASSPAESGTYTPPAWPEERSWQLRRLLRGPPAAPADAAEDDVFLKALRAYLEAYQFGTGHTATLLEAMETSSGMPLKTWAAAWTTRAGSPLLMVSRTRDKLRVEQIPPPQAGAGGDSAAAWWIPLTYHSSLRWSEDADVGAAADTEAGVPWLEMHETVTEVAWPQAAEAVKVNAGHLGAFRVAYSEVLWEALHSKVPMLPAADLAGLLADSWALAFTTELPTSHFLRFAGDVVAHAFPGLYHSAEPDDAPAPATPPPTPAAEPPALASTQTQAPNSTAAPAPGPRKPKSSEAAPGPAKANAPKSKGHAPAHHRPAEQPSPPSSAKNGTAKPPSPPASARNGTADPPPSSPHPPADKLPKPTPHPAPSSGRRLTEAPTAAEPAIPPRGESAVFTTLKSLQQMYSLMEAAEMEDADMVCSSALTEWVSAMILGPAADAVGMSGSVDLSVGAAEPWELRLVRAAVAQLHAVLGPTAGVANLAANAVLAYLYGEGPLHADVRSALFAVAVRTARPEDGLVLQLRAHLQASADPAERDRVLRALAFDNNIEAAFEYVRSGQVKAQDIPQYIVGVAEVSQQRRGEMWEFCKVYKETLKGLLGGTPEAQELALLRLQARVAAGFAAERRAEEVEDYFRGGSEGGLPQFAVEAVDQIRANVAARDRVVRGTCEYLKSLGFADYSYFFGGPFTYSGGYDYMEVEFDYSGSDYGYGVEDAYIL